MTKNTARRPRRRLVAAVAAAAIALSGSALAAGPASAAEPTWVADPASYVDTMIGTGIGGGVVGSINNFPGATVPFGMVQFSPDTASTYAGYQYHNENITGFSMNHASAGCNVFGDIPILPSLGDIGTNPGNATQKTSHKDEKGEPGYYTLTFDSGIKNELTATDRVGIARITYPAGTPAQFMVRPGGSLAGNSAADLKVVDSRTVTGSATTGNFCGKGNKYTIYFTLNFDQDFVAKGTWDDKGVTADSGSVSSSRAGAYFTFPAGSTVQAKIAVSYVSVAGAQKNMDAEAPTFDFDGTRTAGHKRWADALSRVQVASSNQNDLKTFYTSLYRSLLHPNTFNDVDGSYIGFDGAIHTVDKGRTKYANFSDWDTYRTLIPLQTMLFPEIASDMAQSLVEDADQSGSLPRWPVANGATGQMTGDNVTALIAQIHAFGGTDFDAAKALDYMVNAADNGGKGLGNYVQRPGAAIYNARHYAPQVEAFRGDHQVVGASITLEWSIDDFGISRLAKSLGNNDVAARFQARSNYWQNLFDPAQNTIAPRNDDGSFVNLAASGSGFGQTGFDEGNSEQYLWSVPQNLAGLTTAIGGPEATVKRLDTFMTKLNVGGNEPYLWLGNEPNFLVPWVYNYVGQPSKTQAAVDRVRTELFRPDVDGAPGNDDLGAMSSWYVWAALGLAPVTPGTSVLTVNTPTFEHTRLNLGNGKTLTVNAPGATNGQRFIKAMSVNGVTSNSTGLDASIARNGGTVDFTLSSDANTGWATAVDSAPPSFPEGGTGFAFSASPAIIKGAAGQSTSADVTVQAFDSSLSSVEVTATSKTPGISVAGTTAVGLKNGKGTSAAAISIGQNVADGYYPVTFSAKAGAYTRTQNVTVQVARADGLASAFNLIATATDASRGSVNFDTQHNGYSRDQLATVGLTPGAAFSVGQLKATWPGSPAGQPDALVPQGQRVVVPNKPTSISFVGAARDGGGRSTATVTLDDGSTAQADFSLGDWVLPNPDGSPAFGNSVVAKMTDRYAVSEHREAYVFATQPYTAPTGRTIVSVTFPANNAGDADKLRVFAIASNGVAPVVQETQTVLTLSAPTVVAGGSVTATVTVSPALDGWIVVDELSTARSAARAVDEPVGGVLLSNGEARVTLTPASVGTHTYAARYVPADSSIAKESTSAPVTLTVTAKPDDGGSTDPDNGGPKPGDGGSTDPGNGGSTDPGNGGSTATPSAAPAASGRSGVLGSSGDAGWSWALIALGALGAAALGTGLVVRGKRS